MQKLGKLFTGFKKIIKKKIRTILQFCSVKLNKYINPVSIIVISVIVCLFIYLIEYSNRYRHYDWWNWKKKAFIKTVFFVLSLTIFKILI